MTASIPIAGATWEDDQGDNDRGALRPPTGGDHQRDSRGKWTKSPSPGPTRPWKHVTFQDMELSSVEGPLMRQCAGQSPNGRKAEECQFGAPTYPGARMRVFPGGADCCTRGRRGCDLSARALCGELWSLVRVERLPVQHARLMGGVGGHPSCRQPPQTCPEVMSFFWDPQVRCKALKVSNDYSSPPAPKCVHRKAFLPIPDPRIPYQDYREGQPWKTLVYAQALQYWAEKANPPKPEEPHLLLRCVSWVEVGHEAFYHLHWWSCLWRNHT